MRGMIGRIQARVDLQETYEGRSVYRMCVPSIERMRRKEGPARARRSHRYIRDHICVIVQMNFGETLGTVTVLVDCPESDVKDTATTEIYTLSLHDALPLIVA